MKRGKDLTEVEVNRVSRGLMGEFKRWLQSSQSNGCFPPRTVVKAGTTIYHVNREGIVTSMEGNGYENSSMPFDFSE